MTSPRQRGFTLLELMIVLAVSAVILSIGIPNFREFRLNSRMTTIANDFLTTLVNARSEALKRQDTVSVCYSATPGDAAAACDAVAPTGWIAFADANGNCLRDAFEEVVSTGERPADEVDAAANGNCASFGANGFLRIVPGRTTVSRAMFCDERGNVARGGTLQSTARGVELLATGRANVETRLARLTAWGGGPAPVSCP
jgi:type IV fimbrial biogenesis protein FimT